jgi:hypothetical protein
MIEADTSIEKFMSKYLGRSDAPSRGSALATHVVIEPQDVFGAAHVAGPCTRKASQNTRPTADCPRPWQADKNPNTAPRGGLSLDKRSPHKG